MEGISVLVRKSVMCLESVKALALVIGEGVMCCAVMSISVLPPHVL